MAKEILFMRRSLGRGWKAPVRTSLGPGQEETRWSDSIWPVDRTDVVVIGAGVMGSATARALAERGVGTILLEQFKVGHTRGSSHGAVRIFRLSYPEPDYVRLAERALREWRRLESDASEELLVTTGGLDVGPGAAACANALDRCGIAREWLSVAEATERFPGIAFGDLESVLFQKDAGVCLADRTVAALVRLARAGGVEVREETPSERFYPAGEGVTVETSSGRIEARAVVVTAGPWAEHVLAASVRAPSLAPMLQTIGYFAPAGADSMRGMPTLIDWDTPRLAWYAVPAVGESPGVKIGDHTAGVPVDPREGPFQVDPAQLATHSGFVGRRLPGLIAEPVRSETCLYTMTPDEDFLLDREGPFVIGGGFSGHGFKFAPLIGEILADLATGLDPGLPAERFSLRRPVRPLAYD